MDGIVIPSSQALFDAIVYSNGELIAAPKTDDDVGSKGSSGSLGSAGAEGLVQKVPRVE
jgi:hypothetical protein